MNAALEERIWAYLDGMLSKREIERFERDLLDPEVAQAFSEALMLRELLRCVGPGEAPADLVSDIEEAVLRDVAEAHPETRRRLFERTRAAFGGLSWAVRGPQRALAGSLEPARGALFGIGNTRYTLGPLADRGREREVVQAAAPRRSWWRRAIRRGK